MARAALLGLACLLALAPAARALEVPELHAHVLDRAHLLSGDAARRLEQELTEFERTTGHQVVVHLTPSLEGLEIEDYSMQLAQAWKVGQKGLDNGVILTVAPHERRVRIEVGYGLEGVLPDAIAARIIREQITPAFAAGRMDEGVVAGTDAILAVIRGEVLPLPKRRGDVPPISVIVTLIALGIVLLIVMSSSAGPPGMGRGRRGGWGAPIFFPPRGGFGRGGFGGGGFGGGFGGGGGGFGGGGASGRW